MTKARDKPFIQARVKYIVKHVCYLSKCLGAMFSATEVSVSSNKHILTALAVSVISKDLGIEKITRQTADVTDL